MWRALFLSLGVYCVMLGLECLFIDKAVLNASQESSPKATAQRLLPAHREVVPPEWAPWSLLSGGAVVILYTFTIPKKMMT